MKLHYKYDTNTVAKKVILDHLEKHGITYDGVSVGYIDLRGELSLRQIELLNQALQQYGIQILSSQDNIFVQNVIDTIREIAHSDGMLTKAKMSVYLSQKFHKSYSNIARTFTEVTLTSIERFYIFHKIEKVKTLLTAEQLTLTEIAWQMGYSSVPHLSNQFKKFTGLTPTQFQRILQKRREITE